MVGAVLTFVAFLILQFFFHWGVLVAGGVIGAWFFGRVMGSKRSGWGMLIGTILFGVFAVQFGSV
jgi:hypothetical protein